MEKYIPTHLTEIVWVTFVFLFGCSWGSFINVVAGRLPLEKSVLWPNSRCLSCLSPLRFADNLPIIGWLRLRGRCRFCQTPFSIRYLVVELLTGLIFAGLFVSEVMYNSSRIPYFDAQRFRLFYGDFPWQSVAFFLVHAVLASFLLTASICDIDYRTIPLSLTTTGTILGLVASVCFPWPWPNDSTVLRPISDAVSWSYNVKPGEVPSGLTVWPVWGPLPTWLPPGSPLLGLLTGLTGAFAGMFLVRCVKFLFEKGLGREAMGLGDADLLMMAGAFVGWQVVVIAFFVGSMLSLPLGILLALRSGERTLPFGPGLALGVMVTLLGWPWFRQFAQPFLFDELLILFMATLMGGGMFVASFVLRLLGRGSDS